jgi:hypothetical protein
VRRCKIYRPSRLVEPYRVRDRRRRDRLCALQYGKAFPAGHVGRGRRELFTHESCVVADDQGLSRPFILPFQIAADRVTDTPNISECEIVCNNRTPA